MGTHKGSRGGRGWAKIIRPSNTRNRTTNHGNVATHNHWRAKVRKYEPKQTNNDNTKNLMIPKEPHQTIRPSPNQNVSNIPNKAAILEQYETKSKLSKNKETRSIESSKKPNKEKKGKKKQKNRPKPSAELALCDFINVSTKNKKKKSEKKKKLTLNDRVFKEEKAFKIKEELKNH